MGRRAYTATSKVESFFYKVRSYVPNVENFALRQYRSYSRSRVHPSLLSPPSPSPGIPQSLFKFRFAVVL